MYSFSYLPKVLVFFLALFVLDALPAQRSTIHISDAAGKELADATVICNGTTYLSDNEGRVEGSFSFPLSIQATYVGYNGLDTTIRSYSNHIALVVPGEGILLKEGLITASWANETSAVTQKTISKSSIYTNNPVDMPGLLELLPGAVSTSDAGNGIGYSALRIRGSDQTRINVMIDGVPVNDAESQNVFWVDLPDLIEDVQSIQVQRGVGVSTAGPGAFGANINLRTGLLDEKPVISLNAGYGSFNSQKYGIVVNSGTVGKYFRFKVRGSRISSDGYIDRASSDLWAGSFQSQYIRERFSLAANVYWGKEITYQAWNGMPIRYYMQDRRSTYNPAGLKGDGTFFDDETDNYRQIYSRLIARYRFNQRTNLQATLYNTLGKGYYNQYREENIAGYFEDVAPQDVALVRERWLDNTLSGLNLVLDYRKGSWSHQAGGNIQYYHGAHYGIIKNYEGLIDWNPRRYYDNDADKQESSLFFKTEKNVGRFALLADLQIRQLHYSYIGLNQEKDPTRLSENFLFFNPKAGLTYFTDESRTNNLYLFGGIANKEPNRDDFTDAAPGVLPRPERLYNGEAGYRFSGGKFNLQANIYYIYYKDQLVLTGRINDAGAYTRFNVDRSDRLGVEVDLGYRLNRFVQLNGNIALSKNTIYDFDEYIDVSELIGNDIEYYDQERISRGNTDIAFSPGIVAFGQLCFFPLANTARLSKWRLTYSYKHVGSQYLDNSSNEFSRLPAYNIHSIGVQLPWMIARHQLVFNCQVDNIFDQVFVNNGWTYRFKAIGYDAAIDDPTVQSEGHNYYSSVGYYPQAGRRFFIGIKYTFR